MDDLINMARPERFELPTARFVAGYSIQLSYGRAVSRAKNWLSRGVRIIRVVNLIVNRSWRSFHVTLYIHPFQAVNAIHSHSGI